MIKIAPSIASGPLTHLAATINELEQFGADVIHFDIEDGSFVPELNLGFKFIKELRPLSILPYDVHLMMNNPEWLLPRLADAGVDSVSVHYEACPYPRRTLGIISDLGMRAGLAFNPGTLIPNLEFCMPFLSFIVVLSSEPEIVSSPLLPSTLEKIKKGKKHIGAEKIVWVVDGGVNIANIKSVRESGADMVVVGRGIFSSGSIRDNLINLRQEAG